MRIVVRTEVEAESERHPSPEELDEVAGAAAQALLSRVAGRRARPPSASSRPSPPPGCVWQGDVEGSPVRVRRGAPGELIAERRDRSYGEDEPGGWRATDDEDAMRAFEQALLDAVGPG